MGKTVGDLWRESDNAELATEMVDFVIEFFKVLGVEETVIDMTTTYTTFLEYFNTQIDDVYKNEASNGYSYLN